MFKNAVLPLKEATFYDHEAAERRLRRMNLTAAQTVWGEAERDHKKAAERMVWARNRLEKAQQEMSMPLSSQGA